ncbi:hypothetical protein CJU89_0481 [Yarrowia sp. B02]|nr:hypothetical protein CJU89_0481 [Yarrowia sp. B02]
MSKKEDGSALDAPHTPPADKQSFLPTPLASGQSFEPETDAPAADADDTQDTQPEPEPREAEDTADVSTPVARPVSRPQTPVETDPEKEALVRNWKPLTEEEIAQGGEPVADSLRAANETIEALTALLAKTRIQKSHFQLQNKLLTIETHEAAQRYEVENNIAKREVDRLRLAEQDGDSPRQLLGEYNKSSTKVLESYKRKLRRAKLRLEDAVFDIEWRDREIQRLRARLEPATPQAQQHPQQHPAHHLSQQPQPMLHHPQQQQQQQPPPHMQTPHHPSSLQSSPVLPYFPQQQLPPQGQPQHHPMSPVGMVHKGMGHRRTQSAYENRQLDSRPPPLSIGTSQPPRQHIQAPQSQQQGQNHRMDALGLLASQALHEHNRRSPTELMSPVAFRGSRQLQPPPAHIMSSSPVAVPSSPLRETQATELPPSSPEKRRRGSSASTISAPSDDENLDSQLNTTPGTPSPVRSKISPKKKLAQERELSAGGVNRVLDFSPAA